MLVLVEGIFVCRCCQLIHPHPTWSPSLFYHRDDEDYGDDEDDDEEEEDNEDDYDDYEDYDDDDEDEDDDYDCVKCWSTPCMIHERP